MRPVPGAVLDETQGERDGWSERHPRFNTVQDSTWRVWNDDPPSKLPGDTEVEIGWPDGERWRSVKMSLRLLSPIIDMAELRWRLPETVTNREAARRLVPSGSLAL